MYNQIEILDQSVCVEKNESMENEDTYVHDITASRCISNLDRVDPCDDFMNQGLVTTVSSSHDNYMYDDVTNASKFEVFALRSHSCASEEAKSYLSNHE